jgi:hypothetical protein
VSAAARPTSRTSLLERALFHGVRYTPPRACYMSDQSSPNVFQFKVQIFHSTHILVASAQIIVSVISRDRIFMTCHIFYLTSFSMPKLISTRFWLFRTR